MKQQNNRLITKPVKSHSARTFVKSARQRSPLPHRRIETLHTEPLETETYASTRRHLDLDLKTSRLAAHNSKNATLFLKPAEELSQQNRRLKIKLHQLQDELLKEKSRHLQNTKGLQKIQKQFDVEFEQEKHFEAGKGQAVVEGVKYQYQKMKQKYQEKCREYDALLSRYEMSAGEECRFYAQALEIDNKKLKEKLNHLLKTEEKMFQQFQDKEPRSNTQKGHIFSNDKSKEEHRQKIAELLELSSTIVALQTKVQNYSRRHAKMKIKHSIMQQSLQQKTKKIEYFDKLLTDKSNECHKNLIKERKMNKEIKTQAEIIQKMKTQLQIQEEKYRSSVEMLKEKENTRFETEKRIFKRALAEKDEEIEKLKHEIQYLSTILSYLKTGDDPFKMQPVATSLSNKNVYPQNSRQLLINLEKSLTSFQGQKLTNRKRIKTLFESTLKQPPNNLNSSRVLQINTQNLKQIKIISDDEMEGQSEQGSNTTSDKGLLMQSRIVKKSYFKHNPQAQKMRHVKPSQIDHLKKELALRFMFHRLTMDSIKDYFDLSLTKEEESLLTRKERRWKTHYITMKEIREKLLAYPFDLKPEEAFLMARYMVEDATKEDVYCQEDNEVERTIAKSIIKAFVGEYVIPEDEECKAEIKDVLQKSGRNLRSALTSLAPTGFISSVKFLEICEAIQVDFSENTKNWILSQLFSRAPLGLSHLEYAHLFEGI